MSGCSNAGNLSENSSAEERLEVILTPARLVVAGEGTACVGKEVKKGGRSEKVGVERKEAQCDKGPDGGGLHPHQGRMNHGLTPHLPRWHHIVTCGHQATHEVSTLQSYCHGSEAFGSVTLLA